ncbi:MAG: hypothetical protein ACRCY3_01440 [Sphingorhabdus sp.]
MTPNHASAQNGPAEFSSAPCSSLAIGPTDEMFHVQRIYLFKGTEQTTQYKYFADPECTKPMYSFVFKGFVEMGQPVKGMADTVEAKVTFTQTLFTLDSPRGMSAAASCADGKFDVGVQRDVSDTTCLFMRPIKECGFDYDIVRMKDGIAIPGFRTVDMCTPAGRPTKLQSVGAKFVEQF